MKKIIILSLICCTLFITGCGCEKKNEKTIECISEINDFGEKNIVTAKFKDDLLVYEKIDTIVELADENQAQQYYEMYKDNELYDATLDGKTVSYTIETEHDSDDDIFKYDNFYKEMENDGYKCNILK